MQKKSSGTEKPVQSGKMISVRVEPRVRYLAEIAAIAKGVSMTEYIEWALEESFKLVSLRQKQEPEIIYGPGGPNDFEVVFPDPDKEKAQIEARKISSLSNLLWNESEFMRLLMWKHSAPHLVVDSDVALLNYVHSRKDLHVERQGSYSLDIERINSEWETIKKAFDKTKAKR